MARISPGKTQSAFTLLELIIVLAILGSITAWQVHRQVRAFNLRQAAIAATQLARYGDAVAAYVQRHGAATPAGRHANTPWLKSRQDCRSAGGSADRPYLPCVFPDGMPFGMAYRTAITNRAGAITAVTRTAPAVLRLRGQKRLDLAGEIVAQAMAKVTHPMQLELSARDEILVTYTSVANPDRFLRLDGSNQMQAALNVGGHSIANAGNVEFGRSLLHSDGQTDSLELGGRSGSNIRANSLSGTPLSPGRGRPHIDFHHGNYKQEDFNVRIVNNDDGELWVRNSDGRQVSLLDLPGQTVRDLRIVRDGVSVPKPHCGTGLSPQIFIVPTGFIGTADGVRRRTIAGMRTWAVDNGHAWTTRFEILPEGQRWIASDAHLLALTKCTP